METRISIPALVHLLLSGTARVCSRRGRGPIGFWSLALPHVATGLCSKLWHALIHGSIPIVTRSLLVSSLSEDLPMWIVDNWRDIDWSQKSLLEKRTEILSYYPAYDQLQTLLSLTIWRKKLNPTWNAHNNYCYLKLLAEGPDIGGGHRLISRGGPAPDSAPPRCDPALPPDPVARWCTNSAPCGSRHANRPWCVATRQSVRA